MNWNGKVSRSYFEANEAILITLTTVLVVKWGFIDKYRISRDTRSKVTKVYEEKTSRQGLFLHRAHSLLSSRRQNHTAGGCVFTCASDQKYSLVIVLLTET